jgi:hypothetical protein
MITSLLFYFVQAQGWRKCGNLATEKKFAQEEYGLSGNPNRL